MRAVAQAVTATFTWQNDVSAAVDGAWQTPPFCNRHAVDGTKGLQDMFLPECQLVGETCTLHLESHVELWVYQWEVLQSCDGQNNQWKVALRMWRWCYHGPIWKGGAAVERAHEHNL